ncbi:MAG: DUF885 domain-containing protein [Phycisphaeraceae bacterium]|nr:DUF885 domain-containing protein [Phycisphaeraceae bacterium]
MRRLLVLIVLVVWVVHPSPTASADPPSAAEILAGAFVRSSPADESRTLADAPEASDPGAHAALHALFEAHHRWVNQEFPESALRRGEETDPTRLTDPSPVAVAKRAEAQREFLVKLQAVDWNLLNRSDREHAALFEQNLLQGIDSFERGEWLFAVGPIHGPQQRIPQLHERIPLRRVEDFRNYLKRLDRIPAAIDGEIEVLREGIRRGMVPPEVTVEMVPSQLDAVIRGQLRMLLEPLVRLGSMTTPEETGALRREGERSVAAAVDALQRYRNFLVGDYLPACRETIAAIELPDGEAYYASRLQFHTTTNLDASAIHRLGLLEVTRLRAEMVEVIQSTDWAESPAGTLAASTGDDALLSAFIAYLRSDPRFYFQTPEELIDGYRAICKRVDGLLPGLFRVLPRLPYGVREIPRFMAPSQTTAYYQPGSLEGGVAGFFYANTHALDQRPIYEMIPLALHEAVPGHHLQIALAQELPEQPFFRRESFVTAFIEGWALYAERLGIEMGLYENPYDDFGRLLYEMWRACRLVVDTGMHAKAWSRDDAIAFMLRNTALSRLNIEREVDRYIAWPGQACAYKIGELIIRQLRDEAELRLGSDFDLRAFHEVLLGAGSIPLDLLQLRVRAWIDDVAATSAGRAAVSP